MAGRESQGDLWVLSLGLDLQPPIVSAGSGWLQDTVPRLCAQFGAQRYFDSLSQQALLLLFITSIKVDPWILSAA